VAQHDAVGPKVSRSRLRSGLPCPKLRARVGAVRGRTIGGCFHGLDSSRLLSTTLASVLFQTNDAGLNKRAVDHGAGESDMGTNCAVEALFKALHSGPRAPSVQLDSLNKTLWRLCCACRGWRPR
jgi:hypothetical protein